MNEFYTRNVVEAALLAAGKPLTLAELGQVFDDNTRPKVEEIHAALEVLATEYANRAVEVKETAAGFRIQVRKEFSSEISRLWPERPAKYSRALLETLALIAYRQPITRAEIEAVRGVAVNPNILKTVIERNWVRVVGHRDVPGRPELLGTTRDFLDYFGLRSLDELPPLAELKAMGEYNLQLELPNAGALGIESRADGVEGGVPGGEALGTAVAGLLGVDVAEVVVTGLPTAEGVPGEGAAGTDLGTDLGTEPDTDGLVAEGAGVIAAEFGGPGAADVDAVDLGDVDAMAVVAAEFGGSDAVAVTGGGDVASGELASVAVTVVEFEGVELGGPDLSPTDIAEAPALEWVATDDAEAAHDAVAAGEAASDGAGGADELGDAEPVTKGEASASDVYDSDIDDADDAEADRTLSADFVAASGDGSSDSDAADSDDSETPGGAGSDKPRDALGEAGADDDDDDEDELSADGHDSRELVAAPRDTDD